MKLGVWNEHVPAANNGCLCCARGVVFNCAERAIGEPARCANQCGAMEAAAPFIVNQALRCNHTLAKTTAATMARAEEVQKVCHRRRPSAPLVRLQVQCYWQRASTLRPAGHRLLSGLAEWCSLSAPPKPPNSRRRKRAQKRDSPSLTPNSNSIKLLVCAHDSLSCSWQAWVSPRRTSARSRTRIESVSELSSVPYRPRAKTSSAIVSAVSHAQLCG